MSNSLIDCHIIVTRPIAQTEVFCQLIHQHGGKISCLPLLNIEAIETHDLVYQFKNQRLHWVIFVSANAVIHSTHFRHKIANQLAHVNYASIGRQTTKVCQQYNIPVQLSPQKTYNSESLLALLTQPMINQNTFLIIKGEGGRKKLQRELLLAGGNVYEANVYKRTLPTYSANHYKSIIERSDSKHYTIVALTSVAIATHFINLLTHQLLNLSTYNLILLLGSPRIANQLMAQQTINKTISLYSTEVIIAENPSDASMLQALIQWKTLHR